MNYFTAREAASDYARYRPYFHPKVIAWLMEQLGGGAQINLAFDIGCGTGQSSLALTTLARKVIGVDPSSVMLAEAESHPQVEYHLGSAESLSAENDTVDLVSVGLAFHWFDRQPFLAELQRVLRSDGHFLVYDCSFVGVMNDDPSYAVWNAETYVSRFPTPPRDVRPFTTEAASAAGLSQIAEGEFTHIERFSPLQLAGYLMTQSNVAAAIDAGETRAAVGQWLVESVTPFFDDRGYAEFPFTGTMRLYRKHA